MTNFNLMILISEVKHGVFQEMPEVTAKVKYVRDMISISLWSVNLVILSSLGIVYTQPDLRKMKP